MYQMYAIRSIRIAYSVLTEKQVLVNRNFGESGIDKLYMTSLLMLSAPNILLLNFDQSTSPKLCGSMRFFKGSAFLICALVCVNSS